MRMMIRIMTAALGGMLLFAASSLAQEDEGETHPQCLYLPRVKDTDIIDNRSIIFHMRGGKNYLMQLEYECHGLKFDDSFYYRVSASRLCTTDVITTRSGFSCPIQDFTLMEEEETALEPQP